MAMRNITVKLINRTEFTVRPWAITRRRGCYKFKTRQGIRTFASWYVANADEIDKEI